MDGKIGICKWYSIKNGRLGLFEKMKRKKLYKVFFLLTYRKEHLMKENQFIFQIIRICLCHKKVLKQSLFEY